MHLQTIPLRFIPHLMESPPNNTLITLDKRTRQNMTVHDESSLATVMSFSVKMHRKWQFYMRFERLR